MYLKHPEIPNLCILRICRLSKHVWVLEEVQREQRGDGPREAGKGERGVARGMGKGKERGRERGRGLEGRGLGNGDGGGRRDRPGRKE